ncbi:helix-turn-helix transcriptional regulator [Variovorax sp. PAMC26660]|uniref:helix-turn-helix transcriptional regulator n=1 Tax=Variovorax sp. PAMC26660 TaxID=2762322 RepID=UPI00164DA9A9|nr:helix-turn-helix transcriptional regulator [Variovorax sp. PAMC26660]QNK67844.1 helix-turn-helix transcriptional regulator [Variovorax sp. PAMC26660]
MELIDLINTAREKRGSYGAMAQDLGKDQSLISRWKKGTEKPDASEIAYMADTAGLPIMETVAEMEAKLRPQFATLWRKAMQSAHS